MLREQQPVLGYFIEEARDHVNTIEQGLVDIQNTLNNPEMVNEISQAAHWLTGRAGMLGLISIEHTSHRLEDCFKVLQEHPVQVDEKLTSLFLNVCNTLKVLLEDLCGSSQALSEETLNTRVSESAAEFQGLYEHLELLLKQNSTRLAKENTRTEVEITAEDIVSRLTEVIAWVDIPYVQEYSETTSKQSPPSGGFSKQHSFLGTVAKDYGDEFHPQVLQKVREMLQLFKKNKTPESRLHLQQCCQQLVEIGRRQNFPHWCRLCQAAANAIANPDNSYLTLAKIVVTEIKQAQELVLQGRETEIATSEQLLALLNLEQLELLQSEDFHQLVYVEQPTAEDKLDSNTDDCANNPGIIKPRDIITSLTELSDNCQKDTENSACTPVLLGDAQENTDMSDIDQNHQVGLAELNIPADLVPDKTCPQDKILEISTLSEIDFRDGGLADLGSFVNILSY
ncbi:Hpt domain-containing protein [Anabaenopsis arnoldii]|uniref:Hpt domain-containing protein n=1 Tax=Anabaenopsis arnoldii TaxID=2152938 RepID=A0ABT5AQT0_9CYAN|nr:Hpt domain-containing protein [Anabaenopsis arnoldii]MDB9539621.1 Hpt domain-containing protein [Anabaenopsis arnoldii]MDH6091926.1 Hpt domain-containing protein [Anabaenopsis arnoldii]